MNFYGVKFAIKSILVKTFVLFSVINTVHTSAHTIAVFFQPNIWNTIYIDYDRQTLNYWAKSYGIKCDIFEKGNPYRSTVN